MGLNTELGGRQGNLKPRAGFGRREAFTSRIAYFKKRTWLEYFKWLSVSWTTYRLPVQKLQLNNSSEHNELKNFTLLKWDKHKARTVRELRRYMRNGTSCWLVGFGQLLTEVRSKERGHQKEYTLCSDKRFGTPWGLTSLLWQWLL